MELKNQKKNTNNVKKITRIQKKNANNAKKSARLKSTIFNEVDFLLIILRWEILEVKQECDQEV